MKTVKTLVVVVLLWSANVEAGQQLWAQQNGGTPAIGADTLPSLATRVDDLDQQIRILQRLRELAADSVAAAAKDKVTTTASAKDGFSFKSADGKYALRLRGYFQGDGRLYPGTDPTAGVDNLLIRRARPIIEATVGRYFDFRLMPDFGGTSPAIFDAYWDGKFAPQFIVRAGKFKPPVGLERLQSATDISFAERGLPTNLVPSRDIGFQLSGDISEGVLAYQVGVFNGVPDLANGGDDLSDAKDFAARVFVQPFKSGTLRGLGLGVGGSTGIERGSTTATGLPAYRTPGQQTFFRYNTSSTTPANTVFANGKRQRLSPQGYFYTGPLGLLGEYVINRNEVYPSRRHRRAGAHGVANDRVVLPHRREGRLPESHSQEAFRSQGGRLWRAGAGGALRPDQPG